MIPVGVFCYNRPNHLKACLKALERAMAYLGVRLPLYIFCDAPKREGDHAVLSTRAVACSHPHAKVILREKNKGFRNITDGVTWLLEHYNEAIIVEDDVLVSPDFLTYMTTALARYRNEPRVFVISGFMYFNSQPPTPQLFFLQQQFIWGWGTWKRAWQYYEWDPPDWRTTLNQRYFRHRFDCLSSISFSKMLEKTMTGIWNTWDIQWMFCQARAEGLTLFPYRSLIWNCGAGGGTHGDPSKDFDISLCDREPYIHGDLTLEDFQKPRLQYPLTFPSKIEPDEKALRYLATTFLKEAQRKHPRLKTQLKLACNKALTPLARRPKE